MQSEKKKKRLKGRITFVEICPYKVNRQDRAAERYALRFCYQKSKLMKHKFKVSYVRVMDYWKKEPKIKDIEPYLEGVKKRIKETKPDVVVFLGRKVSKLMGKRDKIDKFRGYWNTTRVTPYQHMLTYSGDEVIADWRKCYSIILDFNKIFRYFKKGKKFRKTNPHRKIKTKDFKICKTTSAVRKAPLYFIIPCHGKRFCNTHNPIPGW